MPFGFRVFFFFFGFLCNFNHTSGTNALIFYYCSVTTSLISIKPQKVEVRCLGYPLAKFQLLMISGLP